MLAVPPRTVSAVQALLANTRALGRQEAIVNRVTFEQIAGAHKVQLEVMQLASALDGNGEFTHRNVILLCSKRAAKSTSVMALLAHEANSRDGVQLYFGKTKPAVRLSIWGKIWKPFCEKYYKGKCTHNDTSMVTTWVTGAVVAFTGTDDRAHVETYMGNKLRRAVIDECFPAGTLVDGRPIESIQVGDIVSCVDHTTGRIVRRRVVRRFKKTSKDICRLRLESGHELKATGNHPIFVRGRGYIPVAEAATGDMLCVRSSAHPEVSDADLQQALHGGSRAAGNGGQGGDHSLRTMRESVQDAPREPGPEAVQSGMPTQEASGAVGREDAYARSAVANIGIHEGQKPYAFVVCSREGFGSPSRHEAPSPGPGRERARADGGREGPTGGAGGMGVELRSEHGDGATSSRCDLSELLQVGSGGPEVEDMYRGRWSEPWSPGAQDTRSEEGGVLTWHRVESVSRDEQGSPDGVTVYNLEVEGAHTYFANGVLVHNCQNQVPSVLNPLTDEILPPSLSDQGGQLILAGTIPEVPAGKFWEVWNIGEGWLKRNWSRFDNPFMGTREEQMVKLEHYLLTTKHLITDSIVRRDWFGEFVFDTDATAYPYQVARNGYVPQEPEWLEEFLRQYHGDPMFDHIHRTIRPNDGTARHGIMAAEPMDGIEVFACAIDPGAKDRFTLVVVGWGTGCPYLQHVFEFSSPRRAKLRWSHIDPIRRLVQERYNPSWWFYDAGGSTVVLDTFVGDTGLPALMPANKAGLHGQVERVGDLMVMGIDKTMVGSACEEDYQKAQWNADARAKMQWAWDSKWHPDPAESKRYATSAYFESFEPAEAEKSREEKDRERHELAVRRRNAQRSGMVLDEDMDAAIAADEEDVRWD